MIEKVLVGRYLKKPGEYFQDNFMPDNPSFPAHFLEAVNSSYNIGVSVRSGFLGTGPRSIEMNEGAQDNVHRIFKWLPYVPGKVTCIRDTGHDVLTGKMSGCWITRFNLNGIRYIGHIGTGSTRVLDGTRQANDAWKNAVSDGRVTQVSAFNPTRGMTSAQMFVDKALSKEFYAVVDAQGKFYTLVLGMTMNSTWASGKKICAVYPMSPTPYVCS